MSTLTEEQKRRIEENRKKACALRAAKSAAAGNSPTGNKLFNNNNVNPTNQKSLIHPASPGLSRSVPSNVGKSPIKRSSATSTQPLFAALSPKKPDVPSWLGAKPGTKTSPIKSFYSKNTNTQATTSSPPKEPFCSPKKFYDAGTNYANQYGKKEQSVKGKCVLLTRERFVVEVRYCAPLIDVFKTMKTKSYDMQTKMWSFALTEYRDLLHQMSPVACIAPLPRCVITAFSPTIQSRPRDPAPPSADLSSVSTELVDQLLPFQRIGVDFAIARAGRVLIADDMGLGKTIQALCVCAYYRAAWPLLIVVPSSLRYAWREALCVCAYYRAAWPLLIVVPSSLRYAWREQILRFLPWVSPQEINIVVTGKDSATSGLINIISYDLMVRRQEQLNNKGFRIIVMDESHFLKNSKTARTKTALPLLRRARHAILLSGTPALSRPAELYPQISAVDSNLFPKFHDFGVRYCAGKQMPWGMDFSGSSHLEELQLVLEEKVMIRRLKKDVLSELPAKIRQMVVLDSSSVKINKEMKNSHKYIDKAKGMDRRGALLEYFHDTAEAKIPAVRQYVLDLLESGHKFLLFAHHQTILNALEEAVTEKKYGSVRIDGATSAEQRNHHVKAFQSRDDIKVALLSITAANSGLNLTAATLVVFAELFWNPGILVQAEDRAHRIGQQDSVSVHYLVATGTADDYVWPLVKEKLAVLGRAGLSKEDFAQANTTHVKDPRQKDLMDYFEESFFEEGTDVSHSGEGEAMTASGERTDGRKEPKQGTSGLFQYFKPDKSKTNSQSEAGSSTNHAEAADPSANQITDGSANQKADDMDYSWLEDDFEDNVGDGFGDEFDDDDDDDDDPDAPWPKKPKLK